MRKGGPSGVAMIALLALVGASAGAGLGWSAIGEIDPMRFAAKAPTRSAQPNPRLHRPVNPARASLSLGHDGHRTGCVGCRTYPEEYHPVQDAAVEGENQSGPPSNSNEALTRLASSLAEAVVGLARRRTASEGGGPHHGPPVVGTNTNPTAATNDKATDEQAPEVNPI
jgi:hypothetical protein